MKKIILAMMLILIIPLVSAQGNGPETPPGLHTAIINADNETARQQLEMNLERFRERHKERLENCGENCTITAEKSDGKSEITVERDFRVLGLKISARARHIVNEDGDIINTRPNFGEYVRRLVNR